MKWFVFILVLIPSWCRAADKPMVATFPLGGTSPQDLRDRIGFSIREKLDRDGQYDPISGPEMVDMAADAKDTLTFDTPPQTIKDLATGSGAVVLIWGDVSPTQGKDLLRIKELDLRAKDAAVSEYQSAISFPTDVRFAVEKFLQTLPGIAPFAHPNEEAVHHDPTSDGLFAVNPNLVIDCDFATEGHWNAIYKADTYAALINSDPPEIDRVEIFRLEPGHNVLAMRMSVDTAQNNGLACLSDPIDIQPGVRYRISFRYRSDGPNTHVFVKGYTRAKDLAGDAADREVYRLQVPPGQPTSDEWRQVEADLNPQNPSYPVQRLRIDLYGYLGAGNLMFDDVQLKAVGRQSAAATQPSGR
jgi:hypothetical protein